ncbi:hypothetical protein PV325_014110 [Microctonus aethiopoides]|nr:hypothetical protein PV325_014110 [Microctonus aethiopoides]KAK0098806.1 hypothetical protein PV326_002807 [Microctonus aethiopoides]
MRSRAYVPCVIARHKGLGEISGEFRPVDCCLLERCDTSSDSLSHIEFTKRVNFVFRLASSYPPRSVARFTRRIKCIRRKRVCERTRWRGSGIAKVSIHAAGLT